MSRALQSLVVVFAAACGLSEVEIDDSEGVETSEVSDELSAFGSSVDAAPGHAAVRVADVRRLLRSRREPLVD